jgi:hypothetical protein
MECLSVAGHRSSRQLVISDAVMDYVRLDSSDLIIYRIGFGCEQLGGTD